MRAGRADPDTLVPATSPTRDPLPRRDLLLACAVGLILRLLYLAGAARSPLFTHPALEGAGRPPYAWFLAAIGALAGHNLLVPRCIQALLDVGSVFLLGATAHAIWGKRPGVIAAWIAALYGPLIYFQAEISPATLGFFLVAGSLCLAARAARTGSAARSASGGLLLALMTALALAGAAGAGAAGPAAGAGWHSPLRFLGNLFLAWNRREVPCGADQRFFAAYNSLLFRLPWLPSFAFVGPIALVTAWMRRGSAPLHAGFLAIVTLALAATRVCDDARLILVAAAIPFAGFGIDRFLAAFSRAAAKGRTWLAAALAEVACAHGRTLMALGLAAALVTAPFPGLQRARSGEGWATLARAYQQAGDPPAARRAYADAEREGLRSADFYGEWGALEQQERQGVEAEKHLLTAVTLDPGNPRAHATLGDVYSERGSYAQAGQEYAIAAGLIPERAAEYFTRAGEAYEEERERDRAASMFQRALAARPGYEPAARGLERIRRPGPPDQPVKMFPPLGSPADR